jgi:hypothetical protein
MAMRIETFVAEQNLSRFRQQLQRAATSQPQAALFKQLLQQLELLDLSDAQLERINRHISVLRLLIAKQVETIEELRLIDGYDLERSLMVLVALNEIMSIYQTHRQRIMPAVAR